MKTFGWIVGGLIGVVALFLIFGALVSDPEKSRKRAAIESCWGDQSRKSVGQGAAMFIAGACEQMERDFQRQYGVKP